MTNTSKRPDKFPRTRRSTMRRRAQCMRLLHCAYSVTAKGEAELQCAPGARQARFSTIAAIAAAEMSKEVRGAGGTNTRCVRNILLPQTKEYL